MSMSLENGVSSQLVTLSLTLNTYFHILSVKGRVGIYSAYSATRELVCLVYKHLNGIFEFDTNINGC
jgi:hypothetical protein